MRMDETFMSTTFGALLRRQRRAAGLTQEELAERSSLSERGISDLERGARRTPRPDTVALLADALGLSDEERAALVTAARRHMEHAPPRRDVMGYSPPLPQAQPTALIGRADEVDTITRSLVTADTRLLTLTGPAGVGKTRLALAAAEQLASQFPDRFPEGVAVVDLTPIRDHRLVTPAIAHALGFADTGPQPLAERLRDALRERRQLLVLDNFEQVAPAAATLADLLAVCLELALLVTSRVPLHVRWERMLRVSPLPVPDLNAALPPVAELAAIPSVTLFMERARAQRSDFSLNEEQAPLVARLVAQLDGLPLALELAAARLDTLPLGVIVRRLGDRLQLLRWEAPDMPERQHSLQAAVGWSYDLLSDPEQRLFRCLGVFAGQVALDAITEVANAAFLDGARTEGGAPAGNDRWDERRALEALASLAEKSLILPAQYNRVLGGDGETGDERDDSEPVFGMLETVREYAWEQLAALGELSMARQAHARYFLGLAEHAARMLHGPDQRVWFLRLEREHGNLRAALRWLLDQDTAVEREMGLRLADALGWFWLTRGYHAEGCAWLKEALGSVSGVTNPSLQAQALSTAGLLFLTQGDLSQVKVAVDESLALRQRQRQRDTAGIAETISLLGALAVATGDVGKGVHLLRKALARWGDLDRREDGVLGGARSILYLLGAATFAHGDLSEAAAFQSAALTRLEAVGDTRMTGASHLGLAAILQRQSDLFRAAPHVRSGLEASASLQDRFLLGWGARATLALLDEQVDAAGRARLLGAADALSQAMGTTFGVWERVSASEGVRGLRQRLEQEGWAAAYREGRSLSFKEVTALALALLDDFAQRLAPPAAPEAIPDL